MATQIKQLKALDGLFRIRLVSKSNKKRRICRNGKRRDAVSKLLAKCQSPSEIAELALRFDIGSKEVIKRAKATPNFGLFRMVIANRMRGVISREMFQRYTTISR